jgi:hypothetical protein
MRTSSVTFAPLRQKERLRRASRFFTIHEALAPCFGVLAVAARTITAFRVGRCGLPDRQYHAVGVFRFPLHRARITFTTIAICLAIHGGRVLVFHWTRITFAATTRHCRAPTSLGCVICKCNNTNTENKQHGKDKNYFSFHFFPHKLEIRPRQAEPTWFDSKNAPVIFLNPKNAVFCKNPIIER